jgi:outer membrane protein OmpA-like peptidoglycan-associated protein
MMTKQIMSRRMFAAGLGLVAVSGCSGNILNRVAGAEIDEGAFGSPTMQNMLVMNGEIPALTHLGTRFANEVPTTINFAFNSAALDETARSVLDQQAHFMRNFPEVRFSVFGHTDKVGSAAANQRLGRRRAQAAVAYLGTQGVSRSRLEALVSFGEQRPLVPTESPERANRRTMTEVSGFVGGDPLVLNGEFALIVHRAYAASGGTRFTIQQTTTGASASSGGGGTEG